jgi:hypothetical protein
MLRFNIFELNADLERLHASLILKRGAIIEVIRAKMTALMFVLAGKIVTEKLSGDPLKRRTGMLAGSVHGVPAQYAGPTKIVAAVESSQGASFYGKIQEAGVSHPWSIIAARSKVLAYTIDGAKQYSHSVIHPPMTAAQGWWSSYDTDKTHEWMREELQKALNKAMDK